MNGGANQEEQLASLAVVLPLALAGFSVSAACWTLFAVAGVQLRTELNLSSLQFGLLLAMPMAVSALLAIPAGLAARRVGARRVMLACLAGLSLCMGLLLMTTTFTGYLAVAGGLGLAGGFYSAGLQFVTSHCKPERLGLALGVFGAGVMGAGLNYYLVPLLHEAFSWRGVPLVYLVVLLLVMALLMMLTDDRDADMETALPADGGMRFGGARTLAGLAPVWLLWRAGRWLLRACAVVAGVSERPVRASDGVCGQPGVVVCGARGPGAGGRRCPVRP